jgi:hypothetical protein
MGQALQTAAQTPFSSANTLGYGTTTSILERNVGNKVFYVDPSAAPFTLLTARAGSASTDNPKFEWYEKSLRQKWDSVNGAKTTGDTAITVDDGTVFQINDIVLAAASGELMRVTSTGATVITVTRGVGETAATSLADNADLIVVGSSWLEGADVGIPDEWQESQKFNFVQIFRRPFGVSRTREGSNSYLGQTRPKLRAEKAIEHAIDIERAFLFGQRAETVSGNNVNRLTRGFETWATSNIKDAGGVLTENELEDWCADLFSKTASGDTRVLFASAKVISVVDQLAAGRLQMVPSDKTYGIAVSQYITSHGTLNIVKNRLLEKSGSTGPGAGGTFREERAFAVDPKMMTKRDFVNGSTRLRMDVQSPGVDGWIDEYLSESGLQFTVPAVHGILKNVTA